ncbi:MAG: preprotein translocase subunit SecA [Candidatus Marinimicrobia bacterium]|jgi:preprotein translocase subunit SecA|nr:preprotein translocase subunit SecA [Candidatus Neomarinimicrobiota bacterium]|tara:strand:- start:11294 stop:14350 length:3057 start_codon:yes stop_codon:yes gene_type:complete
MLQNVIKKVFGTRSNREMKQLIPLVDQINQLAENLVSRSDEDLRARTEELKASVVVARESAEKKAANEISDKDEANKFILTAEHEKLEEILPEAFAMVKETCRRMCGTSWKVVGRELDWEMVPYDVQVLGGVILHRGNVAEMKTGEGKTLVAAFPIYLNALTGRGVHLITVNDYLAQRDAEWMGEIYRRLGLTVGFILNNMTPDQRRENYNCDITYGTNNEFGFDYLRDNMSLQKTDQVQRGHAYAIVDEVDSVLIDEARTPLIISGAVDAPVDTSFRDLRPLVQNLVRQQNSLISKIVSEGEALMNEGKDRDAGYKLLQALRGMPKHPKVMKIFQEGGTKKLAHQVESEFMRDKKLHEVDEDLFFSIDEKTHVIDITEKGRNTLAPDNPETFVIPDLGEMLHDIDENESLPKLEKDQEKDKAHQIHADRSGWIHNMTQLLRAYTLYEKDVEYVVQDGRVQIVDEFTGRVLAGRRYSDGLHQALEAKENVTVERETQTLATITIQNYFRMYDKLAGMTGTAQTEAEEFGSIYNLDVVVIPTHRPVVRDDREDLIYKTTREKYNAVIDEIASCHHKGQPTLVGTISVEASELLSRMLKRRGIPHNVLNAKQHQSEAEIVARAGQRGAATIATNMAGRGTDIKLGEGMKGLGGLHIIGTERHESRRIDLQLRGRSGRQGDPGSSVFYLSLEDDLMRLFNSERIASIMDRLGAEEGEVITAKMVTRAIENAQKKVEQRNFGIRKHLLEYDDVMNQQRQVVYDLRKQALNDEDITEAVDDMVDDYVDDELARMEESSPQDWDWENLKQNLSSHMLVDANLESVQEQSVKKDITLEDVRNFILKQAKEVYETRESLLPPEVMRGFEKFVVLRTIDEKWKDHLYAMDQLREGINLRAYGQKNPLLEYKAEGFQMFQQMMADTTEATIQRLYRTQIQGMEAAPEMPVKRDRNVIAQHDESTGMGFTGPSMQEQAAASSGAPKQPIHVEEKIGRNEKIRLVSPSGKQVEVKFKKLQQYLNQGYTQV